MSEETGNNVPATGTETESVPADATEQTSDVAPASDVSRPGVATATSRASDTKEDFNWAE